MNRTSLFIVFLVLIFTLSGVIRAQTPEELARDWKEQHITRIDPSQVRHSDLKKYLDELRVAGVKMDEVGRSLAGREIYQLEFGRGPVKVFMWSQMHGDEPTATSALIDLFSYLQRNRQKSWIKAVEEKITLRAVPMLNPDGAELFQRRNLQFIDINRDARQLTTPEGRLLKSLRDQWSPNLGFNLHNQNTRTSVGDSGKQATISLLAVPYDQFGNDNPARIMGKRVCAIIYEALSPFIFGQIARYDDSFNPRAFGDLIAQSGTPVVLIETGGWQRHTEMDLVQLNFVALAATLRSFADGAIERANPAVYDSLRYNTSGVIYDMIVRGAIIVNRFHENGKGVPPFPADLAISLEGTATSGQKQIRAQIAEIGDLSIFSGLETIDASGYYVTVANGSARPGNDAALLFYRRDRGSGIDWDAIDLESRFPPDSVFRSGTWSGKDNLPRR